MNFGAKFCYFFMLSIGFLNFFIPIWGTNLSILSIILFSISYFTYYIMHKEIYKDVFSSILTSILIMTLIIIPVIGIIIVLLWALYNIKNSLDSIKNLLPELGFSLVLYFLLIMRGGTWLSIVFFLIYAGLSYFYCLRINKISNDSKDVIFRMSIMWLSYPIIAILVMSIVSSMKNIFQTKLSSAQSDIKVQQQVSAHMRGDNFIESYTRNISKTITQTSTEILPGIGSVNAAMTGSMAEAITSEEKNIEDNKNSQKV